MTDKTWIAIHTYCSDVPRLLIDINELQLVRDDGVYLHLATRTHTYTLSHVEEISNVILAIMNILPGSTYTLRVQTGFNEEPRFK